MSQTVFLEGRDSLVGSTRRGPRTSTRRGVLVCIRNGNLLLLPHNKKGQGLKTIRWQSERRIPPPSPPSAPPPIMSQPGTHSLPHVGLSVQASQPEVSASHGSVANQAYLPDTSLSICPRFPVLGVLLCFFRPYSSSALRFGQSSQRREAGG